MNSIAGNDPVQMAAFVGGIDLFNGRYDDANKHLSDNFDTLYKDDWVNPSFSNPYLDKRVDSRGLISTAVLKAKLALVYF